MPTATPSTTPAVPGPTRLRLSTRVLLLLVLVLPNLIGAAVVVTLAVWILPLQDVHTGDDDVLLVNMLVMAGYVLLAVLLGVVLGHRLIAGKSVRRHGPNDAARALRRIVRRAPLRLSVLQGVLWGTAAVTFLVLNVFYSWRIALQVGPTVLLGGLATVSITYRLVERVFRGEVQRAYAGHPVPRRRGIPGVVMRTFGGWLFGTAVPLLGVMFAAIGALAFGNYDLHRLAVVVLILGAVALVFGGVVITLSATSIAAPVLAVRRALHRVEQGDLDVDVPVFDTSELGQLQAGFNTMAAGLRERERVRDLFGRHVGEDVARHALDNELDLRGEVRDVAVLFADVTGSTRLAATRPPAEVVELLNAFFAVVIDVVEQHGGWINKFEGDAALAVFGAPSALDDPAARALAAARMLADRLAHEVFAARPDDELGAGIGVSAGDAVAGNIGDRRRYEYTVIGDPVNEAARLCDLSKELATESTGGGVGVAASGAAVHAAAADERAAWTLERTQLLRGRTEATEIHVPADAPGPGTQARSIT